MIKVKSSGDAMTLAELARELNVSIATVSNAITGKGRMSDEKRQAILEAAIAHGYDMTKVEERQRKKIIHIIVEDLEIDFCTHIVSGICQEAAQMGIQPVIFNLNLMYYTDPLMPEEEVLGNLFRRCMRDVLPTTCGVIYVAEYPRDMTRFFSIPSLPFVFAYCYSHDYPACVNYDDAHGAYIATQHLIACGCKSIAMISGPINSIPMAKRLSGYQRALVDGGIEYDPLLVRVGSWLLENGYTNMKNLLCQNRDIDAVFCQSDHIALGAVQAIREMERRIPEDIRIVGFDNQEFSWYVSPTLTSIVPPHREIGIAAFRMLATLMGKKGIPVRSVKLPCSIEKRESTRST